VETHGRPANRIDGGLRRLRRESSADVIACAGCIGRTPADRPCASGPPIRLSSFDEHAKPRAIASASARRELRGERRALGSGAIAEPGIRPWQKEGTEQSGDGDELVALIHAAPVRFPDAASMAAREAHPVSLSAADGLDSNGFLYRGEAQRPGAAAGRQNSYALIRSSRGKRPLSGPADATPHQRSSTVAYSERKSTSKLRLPLPSSRSSAGAAP